MARAKGGYVSVRFGNVLGSRGSVIPLFHDQIRRGGPLTITHEEMTRYFMTIPEAAQLVLQAGMLGQNGKVFVLDMGEPVRIVDLATDMARLSGLQLGYDIDLLYTGMRPGEKLHEELLTEEEEETRVVRNRIAAARSPAPPRDLEERIAELDRLAEAGDRAAILEGIRKIVPTYAVPGGESAQPPRDEGEVIPFRATGSRR